MNEYISHLRLATVNVERHDPGTSFSSVAFAHKVLRSCGLSKLEQRSVLASAGAVWDPDRIIAALKLLYEDAHAEDRRRPFMKMNHDSGGGGGAAAPRPQGSRYFPSKSGSGGKGGPKGGYKGGYKKPYSALGVDGESEAPAEGDYGAEEALKMKKEMEKNLQSSTKTSWMRRKKPSWIASSPPSETAARP